LFVTNENYRALAADIDGAWAEEVQRHAAL
jgi:hypothetical protein